MKKVYLSLVSLMVIFLAACGGEKKNNTEENNHNVVTESNSFPNKYSLLLE